MLMGSMASGLVIESVSTYKLMYVAITGLSILIAYMGRKLTFRRLSERQAQTLWVVVVSLLFAVFAAIRPMSIPDTGAYLDVFNKLDRPRAYAGVFYRLGRRIYNMEVGFIFFLSIMKQLFHSFRFTLFCIALINGLVFLGASAGIAQLTLEQINFAKVLAMFFSLYAYHYCCIAIRAGTSFSLGMLAVYLVLKRKYAWSLVIFYAAVLFHSMAILFLPFIGLTVVSRGKTGFPASVLFYCSLACLCVLTFNLGARIIKNIADLLLPIFRKAHFDALSTYLTTELGDQTGKRIWLTAVASVAILFSVCRKGDVDRNMILMVLLGLFITSFLYPVTAISRASDYCFAFLLPIIASCRIEKLSSFGKIFMGYAIFPIFFALQMTI